jgi:Tfp pilus assembly protein PilF
MQNTYTRSQTAGAPAGTDANGRAAALMLIKRATTAAAAGDSVDANTLFAQATELAPDEVLVHVRWGLSLFQQKAFAEAAGELTKAMELGGRSYGIAYPLGKCLARIGDYQSAEKALRVAIEDLPHKAGPFRLLAKILRALGRNEEATAYFRKSDLLRAPETRVSIVAQSSIVDALPQNI